MNKRDLLAGEIVQISPSYSNAPLAGCLAVVDEPQPWGAQLYATCPSSNGVAVVLVEFEDMEPTGGKVVWSCE